MNNLSEFPTEALLYQYRKHRYCFQKPCYDYYIRRTKSGKLEVWHKVLGKYDRYIVCIYMTLLEDKTPQDIFDMHTVIKSTDGGYRSEKIPHKGYIWVDKKNFMKIHFGKLYWEGQMEEVKEELAKRPNVNIDGGKAYHQWLAKYKKNLKK